MSNMKKLQRCEDALAILTKDGNAVFFTLTTPDVVDILAIRERWRNLRHWLVRRLGKPAYVMNYERHPGYLQKLVDDGKGGLRLLRSDGEGHGWHIHGVMSCFVPLSELQDKIRSFGFGRVDVRRVTSRGVSSYLTKHALKAYRGLSRKERENYPRARLRLVNASRGLPSLDDYAWSSPLLDSTRNMFREWYDLRRRDVSSFGGRVSFREVQIVLRQCEVLSLLGFVHFWEWRKVLDMASRDCVHPPRRRPPEEWGERLLDF